MRVLVGLALAAALAGCVAPAASSKPPESHDDIAAVLEQLYDAFCFDLGGEPDWATQRALFLPGASFAPPVREGRAPEGEDAEAFLEAFGDYVRTGPYRATGLHERIVDLHVQRSGRMAQALVRFEGFVPGRPEVVETQGVDGIQLVHDGTGWRLLSFATEYDAR